MATSTVPHHHTPSAERQACAPYNFIPLPETLVALGTPDDLPGLDRLATETHPHSGHLDVEIRTESPLFIRGPVSVSEFAKGAGGGSGGGYADQVKNRAQFHHTGDPSRPVIPGSSLRGMLRSVVEVASHGKMTRVTDRRLFARSFDGSSMATLYALRMKPEGALRCGFLTHDLKTDTWQILETHGAKVPLSMIGGDHAIYDGAGPNRTPTWAANRSGFQQYAPVRFTRDAVKKDRVASVKAGDSGIGLPGVLVMSGAMQGKKHDWIFAQPGESDPRHDVTSEQIERFNDDDQVTRWQERAFAEDRPGKGARPRSGALVEDGQRLPPHLVGEPVFFLVEDRKVAFFGRARYFRLPYRNSPLDLVPAPLRTPLVVDYAEALFGYVRTSAEIKEIDAAVAAGQIDEPVGQGTPWRSTAGRVTVSDATLVGDAAGVYERTFTPRILSTPNPTSFQLYLTQSHDDEKALRTYDSAEGTATIRGYKRYWPQGPVSVADLEAVGTVPAQSTQHTRMTPVRAGRSFRFRVHFTALSDRELGALLWALRLPGDAGVGSATPTHVHQLGMGKPFGMGAVSVRACALTLYDPAARYATLFDDAGWAVGAAGDMGARESAALGAFEAHVTGAAGESGQLARVPRVAALLAMMRWPGLRADPKGGVLVRDAQGRERPNTRYMEIERRSGDGKENEYKRRRVLPPVETHVRDLSAPPAASTGIPSDIREESARLRALDGPPGGSMRGSDRGGPRGGAPQGPSAAERAIAREAEQQAERKRAADDVPEYAGQPERNAKALAQVTRAGGALHVRVSGPGFPELRLIGGGELSLAVGAWIVVTLQSVNNAGEIREVRYFDLAGGRTGRTPAAASPPPAASPGGGTTPSAPETAAPSTAAPVVSPASEADSAPAAASPTGTIESGLSGRVIKHKTEALGVKTTLDADAHGRVIFDAPLGAQVTYPLDCEVAFDRHTRPDGVVRAINVRRVG